MSILVQPTLVSDSPRIAENNVGAFWPNGNWRLMWTGRTLEEVTTRSISRNPWVLAQAPKNRRHQKAVDSHTGELMGYVRWILPDVPGVEDLWPEAKCPVVSAEEGAELERLFKNPPFTHDTSADHLEEPAQEVKKRLLARKPYMVLDYLAVHPKYQRRGAGLALVQSGVAFADQQGFDCFLLAFKAGYSTYIRAGFELLDEVVIDDSEIGGPGNYSHYMMERIARTPAP